MFENNGTLTLDGNTPRLKDTDLVNKGLVQAGGTRTLEGRSSIINQGVWDINQANADVVRANQLATGSFVNEPDAVLKRSNANTSDLNVPILSSNAFIEVSIGKLAFNAAGVLSGGTVSNGHFGVLECRTLSSGPPMLYQGTITTLGKGDFRLAGGPHTVDGTIFSGYALDSADGLLFDANTTIHLNGAIHNQFNSLATWGGRSGYPVLEGTGTFHNAGFLYIRDADLRVGAENTGNVEQNGNLRMGTCTFHHGPGSGYLLRQGDITRAFQASPEFVLEGGTFTKSGVAAAGTVGVPFSLRAAASLNVLEDKLFLSGGGSLGTCTLTAGTEGSLYFNQGTFSGTLDFPLIDLQGEGPFYVQPGASLVLPPGASAWYQRLFPGGGDTGVFHLAGGNLVGPLGGLAEAGTFNNHGVFRWEAGRMALVPGEVSEGFVNFGTLEIVGNVTLGGQLVNDAPFFGGAGDLVHRSGTLSTGPGTLLVNREGYDLYGGASIVGSGTFRNNGCLCVRPGPDATPAGIAVPFQNSGVLDVQGGTLTLSGPVANLEGSTLRGGTWVVHPGAVLNMPGKLIQYTAGADVRLRGAFPQMNLLSNAGHLDVGPGATLESTGTLTNQGNLENQGVIEAEALENKADGTIDSLFDYLREAVSISVVANKEPGFHAVNGFLNRGWVRVGGPDRIGSFPVFGSFTQEHFGAISFELAGNDNHSLTNLQYDVAVIEGPAHLGGLLTVELIGGFDQTVSDADTLPILEADLILGAFDNVANGQRLYTVDGAGSFAVHYGPGSALSSRHVVLADFQAGSPPAASAPEILAFGRDGNGRWFLDVRGTPGRSCLTERGEPIAGWRAWQGHLFRDPGGDRVYFADRVPPSTGWYRLNQSTP
jgi:hypothetical protein